MSRTCTCESLAKLPRFFSCLIPAPRCSLTCCQSSTYLLKRSAALTWMNVVVLVHVQDCYLWGFFLGGGDFFASLRPDGFLRPLKHLELNCLR